MPYCRQNEPNVWHVPTSYHCGGKDEIELKADKDNNCGADRMAILVATDLLHIATNGTASAPSQDALAQNPEVEDAYAALFGALR